MLNSMKYFTVICLVVSSLVCFGQKDLNTELNDLMLREGEQPISNANLVWKIDDNRLQVSQFDGMATLVTIAGTCQIVLHDKLSGRDVAEVYEFPCRASGSSRQAAEVQLINCKDFDKNQFIASAKIVRDRYQGDNYCRQTVKSLTSTKGKDRFATIIQGLNDLFISSPSCSKVFDDKQLTEIIGYYSAEIAQKARIEFQLAKKDKDYDRCRQIIVMLLNLPSYHKNTAEDPLKKLAEKLVEDYPEMDVRRREELKATTPVGKMADIGNVLFGMFR